MSQVPVKWVSPKDLHDEKPVWDQAELFVIPVVPLSALREWAKRMKSAIRHLEQKDHDTKNWCDGCSEAQRLLASLGEQ